MRFRAKRRLNEWQEICKQLQLIKGVRREESKSVKRYRIKSGLADVSSDI